MPKTSPQQTGLHKNYVLTVVAICLLASVTTLLFNLLVDPLWFWKGNQLTGINFTFNERQAKLNLLLQHNEEYDCFIFGSSRATLFQSDSVPGHRCFNLAFSSGQAEEFVAYAEYLRSLNFQPRLVIVGVDGFNFLQTDRRPLNIPDYVQAKQNLPGLLATYLSLDAIRFSWRTVIKKSRRARYYTARFECAIQPDAPKFRPTASLDAEGLVRRSTARNKPSPAFSPAYATHYQRLRDTFPDARFVAYVPPISAWHIDTYDRKGALPGYLDSLHATSQLFDVFWDFSIPSATTWNPDNTYDGSHYSVQTNRLVAQALFSQPPDTFGLNVQGLSLHGYTARYREALETFHAVRRAIEAPP